MELQRGTDEVTDGTMAWWHVPGPGPPLVCVHGAGVSSRQTLPLIKALAGRSEAWAVDLPGFGVSAARDHTPTVTGLADSLLEWIRVREITKPCLVGASLGTQVVAEAAVRAPEEVASVVLAGPTTDSQARSIPVLAARLLWNTRYEGFSAVAHSLADYRDAGPRRVVRSWLASRDHRIEWVLPRLRQPALVLRGSKDVVCPQPWVEEVVRLLPRGRLVTVPGQPHALTASAPDQTAALVHDFVQGAAR